MLEFFNVSLTPIFWLVAFVILIIIEVSTYNLTTIWFALSCVPLIFLSWFGFNSQWQSVIFVILTAVFLIFTRPFVIKRLKRKTKNDPNEIAGKNVTVIKKIEEGERGEVKTANGVVWNAMSDVHTEIPEGAECVILEVKGNTLKVKPI